jgi:hypothetical protein
MSPNVANPLWPRTRLHRGFPAGFVGRNGILVATRPGVRRISIAVRMAAVLGQATTGAKPVILVLIAVDELSRATVAAAWRAVGNACQAAPLSGRLRFALLRLPRGVQRRRGPGGMGSR